MTVDLFQTPYSFKNFGYSILLLFWTLVGWEIIGNYSMDVKNRSKTIPKAIALSVIIITIVCLVVAGATQWIDINQGQQRDLKLTMILTPLFGNIAPLLIAFITTILCMSTYLLVTGGVARIINSESKHVKLISLLSYRAETNVPVGALSLLSIFHFIVFIFLYVDLINMEQIVALANAFFISNALCGIVGALKLLPGFLHKGLSIGLIICFLVILSFSSLWVLICIEVEIIGMLVKITKKVNEGETYGEN